MSNEMKAIVELIYHNRILEVELKVPNWEDNTIGAVTILEEARRRFLESAEQAKKENLILKSTLMMPQLGARITERISMHPSVGQFEDDVPKLDCYMLPQGSDNTPLRWPIFQVHDMKQERAIGQSLLFDRCGRSDIGRREDTQRVLLEDGRKTAWVGLPGIGKSVASQSVLLAAIRELGRGPNDIPMVLYRASGRLFLIYLKEATEGIKVKCFDDVDLAALKSICNRLSDIFDRKSLKEPVLVLDLDESEMDPQFAIPGHVSTSLTKANDVLKSIFKGGGNFYLMQPWFEEELQMMDWLHAWSSAFIGLPHSPQNWKELFAMVGGVPRKLFGDNVPSLQMATTEIQGLQFSVLAEICNLCVYAVGKSAKDFLAPVINPGVVIPLLNGVQKISPSLYLNGYEHKSVWKFSFLSFEASKIVATLVHAPAELQAMEDFGLDYQYHQSLVLFAGILKTCIEPYQLPEGMKAPHWHWYITNETLKLGLDKVQKLLATMPNTSKLYSFPCQVYRCAVDQLEERYVYHSSVVNGYLYDFMTVNHATKRVYMWQVTTKTPMQHALTLNMLQKTLQGLSMWGEENEEYKVIFIFCSPKTDKAPSNELLALYVKLNSGVKSWEESFRDSATMNQLGGRFDSIYFTYFNLSERE